MSIKFIRRKKIMVSPVQRKFILIIIVILLLLFGFVEWDIYNTTKALSFTISSLSVESIGALVQSTYNVVMIKVFVFMLVVSLLGIWLAIYLSHRLVGPLYRLEGEIKDIVGNKGNFTHTFKIRKQDEIGSLVEALNLMVGRLREKMIETTSLKKEVKAEMIKTHSLITEKETIPPDARIELVKELETLIKKLEESIATDTEFKVDNKIEK
ncbi:MAG: HAMP domain-containing protein [bacterium]